jgi:hypothetical protein
MAAIAQINLHVHIVITQVNEFAGIADGAASADLHAVEGDVDAVRLEVSGGGSNGSQDSTPVGILAEDRAFEEVAASYCPTDLHRVLLGRRMANRNSDGVRGAFGIG